MKTLILMRHAKSGWKDPDLEDRERPLNKRGKKDAPMMGKLLVEKELIPQIILSSSAVRARLTAEAVIEATDFKGEVRFLDSLYLGEPGAYLGELQHLPESVERVLVVGHNPGLESLLQILSGQVESLPTAAISHLVLPIKAWSELNGATEGDLVELLCPRDLKDKEKDKDKDKEKDKGKK